MGDLLGGAGNRPLAMPGTKVVVGVDAEHVALAGASQGRFDVTDAIDAIGRHPGEGYVGTDGALDHAQGQAGLGGKIRLRRHMGGCHANPVLRPGFGQIKRPVDEGVAMPRDVGRKDADLAVRDLAGRARVLAGDAAAGLALLEEPGLVEDQNRIVGGKGLDDIVAHDVAQRIRVPAATTKNGLLTPGAGIARRLRPHPAGLAPLIPEQAVQE